MSHISYRISNDNLDDIENWATWSPERLCGFLKKAGLGDYGEIFINHKISGRLAPLLSDADLKEMGVSIVGDRLRLKAVIGALGTRARYEKRTKTWWEGKEQLYFSDAQQCLCTCAGCCPDDPSTYKLTSNHLRVKTVNPFRCGPVRLCCCNEYKINNVDLSKVNDVDIFGEPAPCVWRVCCCAAGRDHIQIQTPTEKEGTLVLTVQQGTGERISGMILHQIEEAQQLERD
mmetsp:Transcript_2729/g.3885  ORF Transcript_2729/g.3885 Transcript_2729/m.3885 type:complete len:231 (+) Transcript_2729:60-752(+)|eukprot:CAMPEP_0117019182 /NCGR_PEP_ID=MMETSP0472-20121206/14762_1 /TAXON_ID=693140 ORGANISM="Tiarina fusus, Strain LIS" /NCGR_SAMPLE_ID=MMETSP0472 /ASSEMBLY_ACC=CAM_ASM_000603 /LENGTH=230 /DNA_ID=CAMNT_0004724095 /DNA_START=124 /DNA_END=816 /DNA_ORIENTATION=+